jgi:hypothetical protein
MRETATSGFERFRFKGYHDKSSECFGRTTQTAEQSWFDTDLFDVTADKNDTVIVDFIAGQIVGTDYQGERLYRPILIVHNLASSGEESEVLPPPVKSGTRFVWVIPNPSPLSIAHVFIYFFTWDQPQQYKLNVAINHP